MRRRLSVPPLVFVSLVLSFSIVLAVGAVRVRAQTNPAQAPAAPASRAAILSRAWGAIAEQKHAAADQAVEKLLARAPMDHAALLVRLTARSAAGNPSGALNAYEEWLKRSRSEDVYLLEPIALATLATLAESPDPGVASPALSRLARYDPDRARAILRETKASSPAIDAVAARLGDAEARKRLAQALASPVPRLKLLAIAQLTGDDAPPVDRAPLEALLGDPAPPVRAAAARALPSAGGPASAAAIRPLLQDPDGFVRASAAVALGQMADPEGLKTLQEMLASPVGDTAMMAAAVLKPRGVDVSAAVDRALQDDNPLTRLSAIPLLPDTARGLDLLRQATQDSNPVIRSRAASLLEEMEIDDVALLRALLRDDSPELRTHAAAALAKRAYR